MSRDAAWTEAYARLAELLQAGFPLPEAWREAAFPKAAQEELPRLLDTGQAAPEAFRVADSLPPVEREVLSAAAGTSRLPEACQALSRQRKRAAATQRQVFMALLYPLMLLHLAIFLIPVFSALDLAGQVDAVFQDTPPEQTGPPPPSYPVAVLRLALPFWLALIVFTSKPLRPGLLAVGEYLPAIRVFLREHALASFTSTWGELLDAGWGPSEALQSAGRTTRRKALTQAAQTLAAETAQGNPVSSGLATLKAFPTNLIRAIRTGEETGHLPEELRRYAVLADQRASAALKVATILYPALIYAVVALWVASIVLRAYAGYFEAISRALG